MIDIKGYKIEDTDRLNIDIVRKSWSRISYDEKLKCEFLFVLTLLSFVLMLPTCGEAIKIEPRYYGLIGIKALLLLVHEVLSVIVIKKMALGTFGVLLSAYKIPQSKVAIMTVAGEMGCIISIIAGKFVFKEKSTLIKLVSAGIVMVGIVICVV